MTERDDRLDVDRFAGEISAASRAVELRRAEATRAGPVARTVDRVAEALAASLLGTVTLLVFANAASRYLAGQPLVWTEEAVAALVIWLAVIGGFLAVRRRELIRVRVLVSRLPLWAQVPLEVAVQMLSAMVFAYVSWQGWRYLGVFGGDKTPYFGLPKGFYMAALPVGGLAMMLGFLSEARDAGRKRP
jgi:TRAP-type C4-dicarboxylate transport system permease small subunit